MGVLDDMLAVLAREAEPQEGCRGLGAKIHFRHVGRAPMYLVLALTLS
jgi:hypothetical protein